MYTITIEFGNKGGCLASFRDITSLKIKPRADAVLLTEK